MGVSSWDVWIDVVWCRQVLPFHPGLREAVVEAELVLFDDNWTIKKLLRSGTDPARMRTPSSNTLDEFQPFLADQFARLKIAIGRDEAQNVLQNFFWQAVNESLIVTHVSRVRPANNCLLMRPRRRYFWIRSEEAHKQNTNGWRLHPTALDGTANSVYLRCGRWRWLAVLARRQVRR